METIKWSDAGWFFFPLLVGVGLTGVVGVLRGKRGDESPVCGQRAYHQPPGWVFAVVWPILYTLLGGSLAMLWRAVGRQWTPEVMGIVIGVLALQVWWFIFTFKCLPWGAFAFLVALWIGFIVLVIRLFSIQQWSAILLIPLILWLTFASLLSFEIATGRVK